jgi:hypothetical protein
MEVWSRRLCLFRCLFKQRLCVGYGVLTDIWNCARHGVSIDRSMLANYVCHGCPMQVMVTGQEALLSK